MKRMKESGRIFCAGDVIPDVIIPYGETREALSRLKEGDSIPTIEPTLRAGGSIGQTVATLGILDMKPRLLSVVGSDEYSEFLLNDLVKKGVDVSLVGKQKERISVIIAVLDGKGERTPYLFDGPGAKLPELTSMQLHDELLPQVGWLHCNGFATDIVVDFMERCRAAGAIVSFDLNLRVENHGFSNERRAHIERAVAASDVLFGSGTEEFAPLTGIRDLKEAAGSLATGSRVVVARDGPNPIHVYEGGACHVITFKRVRAVNTMGSGDIFNGGFIAACALGRSVTLAAKWGSCCATHALASPVYHDIPKRAQLEARERENLLV